MTSQVTQRLGQALSIRSGTKLRVIENSITEIIRQTPQSPGTPMTGSIDTSQVISGTFANARIAASNVTQHQAALSLAATQIHGAHTLGNYANDAVAAAGGVIVGDLYRNGSILMVRVV